MGAWGYGIRQDDFVCDVIGAFEDLLKAGKSVPEAVREVQSQFRGALEDPDDGPLFWIALADQQWNYGALDASVLERVKDDLHSGRSLLAWQETAHGLAQRRSALERFIRRIEVPKARPKKPPKTIVRAPKFRPGDCLSIQRTAGEYAAAIVLAADHSTAEYGKNLVGMLDYRSSVPATMDVYRRRTWRVLEHHPSQRKLDIAWYYPIGFRQVQRQIEIAGRVEILDSDPKDSRILFRWSRLGAPR